MEATVGHSSLHVAMFNVRSLVTPIATFHASLQTT